MLEMLIEEVVVFTQLGSGLKATVVLVETARDIDTD